MLHAWSDRDVTRPLDFFSRFFFARDWHVTSMSDHVPDKKTVTSQFHSTLIGTRILKGQNGGRQFGTGKLVEADRWRSTVAKARSDGLKITSHWRIRLNLSVSRAQQEFDTEHSTQKCRVIELEMWMPKRDRRTTYRGNRMMQLLNLMSSRRMRSMFQIRGINMHYKARNLVAARVIVLHMTSGKSRTRMFNWRFRLGWWT